MTNSLTSLFLRRAPGALACSASVLLAACGNNDTAGDATRTAARIARTGTAGGIGTGTGIGVNSGGSQLYVAPAGSDSNPGTQDYPYQTINRAADAAGPGTVVHVAPGTYPGNVLTRNGGMAGARISFVSDTKWGARIVGSGTGAMWTNDGDYVDISGFDISGPGRLGVLNAASNTLVANNHIHDLAISGGCDGNGGAGVVNADPGGANGDIVGNVVHDIGYPGACNGVQGLYSSNTGGKIVNNVVYRVSAFGIHLWHAATDAVIANNTVFANGSAGIGGGILVGAGDAAGSPQLANTKVVNNIVVDNPHAGIVEYCYPGQDCIGAGNTVANNLVAGSATLLGLRADSAIGTILADPGFVSYDPYGGGDYRLGSGSPAIDAGTADGAPATDILGVARPLGGAVDLGAYESD